MKKTLLLTMMAAVLLVALPCCGPDEDPMAHFTDGVVVTTADPTFITGFTASCGSEVTAEDAGLLIELGVCWSQNANPTVDDHVLKSHQCSQPFIGLLTNLEPNTEYHLRGYAQYGTEYCYGSEKTFTTLDSLTPGASPVTTTPAYDINYYLSNYSGAYLCSFRTNVVVEPFGVSNWHAGVCYSHYPDFTMNDCEGYFMAHLEDEDCYTYCYDLMPNTKYYYRAFVSYYGELGAINYFYGEVLEITTPEIPFVYNITTGVPNYWWYSNHLYISGYLNCNKPEKVNEVGFCYSHVNQYPQFESDLHVVAGTPTGEWFDFESDIYNLSANTKYYFRSYIRYMTDSIGYGNVVTIDTN